MNMSLIESAKAVESTVARPGGNGDRIVCLEFVQEAQELARFVLSLAERLTPDVSSTIDTLENFIAFTDREDQVRSHAAKRFAMAILPIIAQLREGT